MSRLSNFLFIVFAIFILVAIFSQYYSSEYFHHIIWGDRELSRSLELDSLFQVFGSEYTVRLGQRTPGGSMHYILWLLQKINPSVHFIYLVYLTLYVLSAICIFDIGRRILNPLAGALSAAIFLTSIVGTGIVFKLWNPLFGFPFMAFSYYFFFRSISDKNWGYAVLSVAFVAISAQAHFSNLLLLPTFFILSLFFGGDDRLKRCVGMIVVALGIYAPYFGHLLGIVTAEGIPLPIVTEASETVTDIMLRGTIFLSEGRATFSDLIKFIISLAPLGEHYVSTFAKHNLIVFLPFASIGLAVVVLYAFANDFDISDGNGIGTRKALIVLLLIIALITGLAFIVFTVHLGGITIGLWEYYSGQIVPAAALLGGISIAALTSTKAGTSIHTVIVRTIALGAMVVIVLRLGVFTYGEFQQAATEGVYKLKQDSRYAYRSLNGKIALFKDIRETFGFGSSKIEQRVSVAGRWDKGWLFYREPSHYLLSTLSLSDKDDSYDGCVLVLSPEDERGRRPEKAEIETLLERFRGPNRTPLDKLTYESVEQIANARIDKTVWRKKYVLVGMRLLYGGCPKSFMNDYILTDKEHFIEGVLSGKKNTVIKLSPKNNVTNFLVRRNIKRLNFPLDLMIEIETKRSELTARVHSKQLRNWSSLNGYWQAVTLERPSLMLTRADTSKRIEYPIFEGALGLNGFRTPWKANPLKLKEGNYQVVLHAKSLGRTNDMRWFPHREYNVEIPLGEISVEP